MNKILPYILAVITMHGRYKPLKIDWSSKSWTHNIYRVWEMIFWIPLGKSGRKGDTIKPFNSFEVDLNRNYFKVNFHCTEAVVAHFEGVIRHALKIEAWKDAWKTRDYLKMSQHPLVVQLGLAGFLFTLDSSKLGFIIPFFGGALAFDAANGAGGSGGTNTFNLTVAGSDRILFFTKEGSTAAAATYNSVSMTNIATVGDGFQNGYTKYLIAPDTGTNALAFGENGTWGAGASYTGANQSGQPDNFNTGASSGNPAGKTLTVSVTSVLDNCWAYLGYTTNLADNNIQSAGTGSTQRAVSGNNVSAPTAGAYDSNSAKTPAGSISMTATYAGSAGTYSSGGTIASFAPVQPIVVVTPPRMFISW